MQSQVRTYRKEKGLSQEDLARALGVSRQTIVNLERGWSVPNVLLALAIAGILSVGVSELFKPTKESTSKIVSSVAFAVALLTSAAPTTAIR